MRDLFLYPFWNYFSSFIACLVISTNLPSWLCLLKAGVKLGWRRADFTKEDYFSMHFNSIVYVDLSEWETRPAGSEQWSIYSSILFDASSNQLSWRANKQGTEAKP